MTVEQNGAAGVGECVADANPYYSAETTRTAWHIIAEFIAPIVLGRDVRSSARGLRRSFGPSAGTTWRRRRWKWRRGTSSHVSRASRSSAVLGGERARIESGVSIGIQDSLEELVERVRVERAAGYRRVKIKIKPGWDVDAVGRVYARPAAIFPSWSTPTPPTPLADADHLAALDRFGLMMIEQPLDYDDLRDHAALQRRLTTPICLDESIHSVRSGGGRDRRSAPAGSSTSSRVGRRSRAVDRSCTIWRAPHGIPVWHGGMLESGIGRAHNIHLSTLPNFTLPGDVAASRRYYAPDLIDPEIDRGATTARSPCRRGRELASTSLQTGWRPRPAKGWSCEL